MHGRLLLLLLIFLDACSPAPRVRPELLVVVDTNLPVSGQIRDHEELSGAAAVDTLRIDVVDPDGTVRDSRVVVAPEAADWPISFGIGHGDPTRDRLTFRLRLFKGERASTGELGGTTTVEPLRELAVDRLVTALIPSAAVPIVRVMMAADCFGVTANFISPHKTRVDDPHFLADPTTGVELLPSTPTASSVGTWSGARDQDCMGAAPPGAVCIRGGFGVLGDVGGVGLGEPMLDPFPLRPVFLKPFFLDSYEFTVRSYRKLAKSGRLNTVTAPKSNGPHGAETDTFCTWLGTDSAANDSFPLNCVGQSTAVAICAALGGKLPSEAQWEYAARGRGLERVYPWGNAAPTCCAVSASRSSDAATNAALAPMIECANGTTGVERGGHHEDGAACNGLADVTRDGVAGMGGSLSERIADAFDAYDGPCWSTPGILADPSCEGDSSAPRVIRGGNWNSGLGVTRVTLRGRDSTFERRPDIAGFRCAYEEAR